MASSLYHCWQNLPSLFLLASINQSCTLKGSISMASLYLAVASYLEPHHAAFTIPIIVLFSSEKNEKSFASKSAKYLFISVFLVCSLFFQSLTRSLVGSKMYWKTLGAIYGETWLTSSPNLSLQWYFRMQLFSRFRDYFGVIFQGIPFVLVGPLSIRFARYPEVLIAAFSIIWTIYRPVQVLYDANFALCLSMLCPRSLARMGVPSFISLCCIMVPVILNVVDHWMWLEVNNGNANYMFFQCLAYNVFLGIICAQFVSASMQRDKALRIKLDETKEEERHHPKME
mmetsp:Transcript_14694/g.25465  ORF Transcript_14694/g.25465 Transcript_14694/m.25465 type:complete len:285 (-) Transcript_14694:134-988(-)